MGANPLFSHPAIIRVEEDILRQTYLVMFWVDKAKDKKRMISISREMLRGVRDPNTIIEQEIRKHGGNPFTNGSRVKLQRADWEVEVINQPRSMPTTAEEWADKWMEAQ